MKTESQTGVGSHDLSGSRRTLGFKVLFAWYDMWIGCYWDRQNRRLYVLPVPCLGIVIQFPTKPWPNDQGQARRDENV